MAEGRKLNTIFSLGEGRTLVFATDGCKSCVAVFAAMVATPNAAASAEGAADSAGEGGDERSDASHSGRGLRTATSPHPMASSVPVPVSASEGLGVSAGWHHEEDGQSPPHSDADVDADAGFELRPSDRLIVAFYPAAPSALFPSSLSPLSMLKGGGSTALAPFSSTPSSLPSSSHSPFPLIAAPSSSEVGKDSSAATPSIPRSASDSAAPAASEPASRLAKIRGSAFSGLSSLTASLSALVGTARKGSGSSQGLGAGNTSDSASSSSLETFSVSSSSSSSSSSTWGVEARLMLDLPPEFVARQVEAAQEQKLLLLQQQLQHSGGAKLGSISARPAVVMPHAPWRDVEHILAPWGKGKLRQSLEKMVLAGRVQRFRFEAIHLLVFPAPPLANPPAEQAGDAAAASASRSSGGGRHLRRLYSSTAPSAHTATAQEPAGPGTPAAAAAAAAGTPVAAGEGNPEVENARSKTEQFSRAERPVTPTFLKHSRSASPPHQSEGAANATSSTGSGSSAVFGTSVGAAVVSFCEQIGAEALLLCGFHQPQQQLSLGSSVKKIAAHILTYCQQHCPCPVRVVHESEREKPAAGRGHAQASPIKSSQDTRRHSRSSSIGSEESDMTLGAPAAAGAGRLWRRPSLPTLWRAPNAAIEL